MHNLTFCKIYILSQFVHQSFKISVSLWSLSSSSAIKATSTAYIKIPIFLVPISIPSFSWNLQGRLKILKIKLGTECHLAYTIIREKPLCIHDINSHVILSITVQSLNSHINCTIYIVVE